MLRQPLSFLKYYCAGGGVSDVVGVSVVVGGGVSVVVGGGVDVVGGGVAVVGSGGNGVPPPVEVKVATIVASASIFVKVYELLGP